MMIPLALNVFMQWVQCVCYLWIGLEGQKILAVFVTFFDCLCNWVPLIFLVFIQKMWKLKVYLNIDDVRTKYFFNEGSMRNSEDILKLYEKLWVKGKKYYKRISLIMILVACQAIQIYYPLYEAIALIPKFSEEAARIITFILFLLLNNSYILPQIYYVHMYLKHAWSMLLILQNGSNCQPSIKHFKVISITIVMMLVNQFICINLYLAFILGMNCTGMRVSMTMWHFFLTVGSYFQLALIPPFIDYSAKFIECIKKDNDDTTFPIVVGVFNKRRVQMRERGAETRALQE